MRVSIPGRRLAACFARRSDSAVRFAARSLVEGLESRTLLSVSVVQPVPNQVLQQDTPAALDLTPTFQDTSLPGTVVEIATSLGPIDVELFDQIAPTTVQNFLNYVQFGLYNGTIIHRVVNQSNPTFKIIQGGGFQPNGIAIPTFFPIPSEARESNVRGTIGMATVGGDPNSATSQWYINDSDNTSLDGQFTVFGQVLSGMNVVDRINGLPTVDGTALNSAFDSELPVVHTIAAGATPQPADLVQVPTVSVLPKVTYKVTSDNVKLLSATINGTQLSLAPVAGQSGIAHVTVVATDLSGQSAVNTFRVEIKPSASNALDVPLGAGRGRSVGFRQADRTHGTISLAGPGSAVVHFAGQNLKFHSDGHVSGQNIAVMGLDATGTTAASTLTVRGQATRRGLTQIGDVTTDGAFNTIRFVRTQLVGDMTVPGGVGRMLIDYARSGTVTLGGPIHPGRTLEFRNASWLDESLSTGAAVQLIRAGNWSNSDNVSETFQAPFVRRLVSFGNFTPGLQLSGLGAPRGNAIGSFRILGTIGGSWSAASTNGIKSLRVGGVASDFNATFASPLNSLQVRGNFDGSLTAPSLRSLTVRGSMTGASLTLQAPGQDLGSLTVRRGISGLLINAAGNIGSISAQSLIGSDVYAGIGNLPAGQAIPASVADLSAGNFVTPATIQSITLHPTSRIVGFAGSNIAAAVLGNLNIGAAITNNGGTPFGVAGHVINRLSFNNRTSKQQVAVNKATDAATLAAQLAGKTLGDMQIRVV